jgi:hypothetical protein
MKNAAGISRGRSPGNACGVSSIANKRADKVSHAAEARRSPANWMIKPACEIGVPRPPRRLYGA